MALEELRQGDQSARPQLQAARDRFAALRSGIDAQLGQLFKEFDATQDREVLARIRGVLNRRRYVENLVEQVEKELAA
jgi:hypothetical protein